MDTDFDITMKYMEKEMKSLKAERDRLQSAYENLKAQHLITDKAYQARYEKAEAELDNFKAGKVYQEGVHDGEVHVRFQLEIDRDLWKALAGKLAEAMKAWPGSATHKGMSKALAAYEEVMKK